MYEKSTIEIASNKLYILYALKQSKNPISKVLLTHIFMHSNLLDFFSLQQHISDLLESQFLQVIINSSGEFLKITTKGESILSLFESRISFSKKRSIEDQIQLHQEELLLAMDRVSRSTRQNDGMYLVDLELHNDNRPYIAIQLEVATNQLSQEICSNWNQRSSEIYFEIIRSLTQKL